MKVEINYYTVLGVFCDYQSNCYASTSSDVTFSGSGLFKLIE